MTRDASELLALGALPILLLITCVALALLLRQHRRQRADRGDLARLRRQRPLLHARLQRARRQLDAQRDLREGGAEERRQWRQSLRTVRSRLERQDLLLASLGHEIRSPLRSLLAVVDLVDRDIDPGLRPQLRIVSDLTRHVLKVAEDSLELASIERGDATVDAAPFELEIELAGALHAIGARSSRRVHLGVDFEPGMPLAWIGDAARLRQIFINLLSNAFHHTEHGAVTISFARTRDADSQPGPGLAVTVRDSGTGIAPGELTRIFEPFVQGAASGGLAGLGLSVVARLAELMAGEIRVDSELGVGSTFTVTLPLPAAGARFPAPLRRPGRTDGAAPPLCDRSCALCIDHPIERHALAGYLTHWGAQVLEFPDPRAIDAHLDTGARLDAVIVALDTAPARLAQLAALRSDHPELRIIESRGEAAAASFWPTALADSLRDRDTTPAVEAARTPMASAAHVLVVDDHPVARRVLLDVLSELGCSAIAAEDGSSAVEIAEDPEERFDWVLLDRQMPGLDGLTTAAALRSRSGTRHAQLVLLVNEAGGIHPEHGLVDAVLVRPAGIEALRSALLALLSTPTKRSAATTIAHANVANANVANANVANANLANANVANANLADADLQQLRDETLSEDLDGLLNALDTDDAETADAHLHRMQGALRICPEPGRCASLLDLQRRMAAPDRDGVRASARRFGKLLAARSGDVDPA